MKFLVAVMTVSSLFASYANACEKNKVYEVALTAIEARSIVVLESFVATLSNEALNAPSLACMDGKEIGRAVNVLHHMALTYYPSPEDKQMAKNAVRVLIEAGVRTDVIGNSESGVLVEQFLKVNELLD